jgi:hypothetical protein
MHNPESTPKHLSWETQCQSQLYPPVRDLGFGLCGRWSVEQRYRLLPYLKSLYHEWGARGRPLVRPLHLHYPDTRALGLWRQFLLGQASVPPVQSHFFHPFFAFCHHFDNMVGSVISEIFLSFLDLSILKVLSSEMDQAKSGLTRKLFIKGRGAEIFS